MSFQEGDTVAIVKGDFAGAFGEVLSYEAWIERYMIRVEGLNRPEPVACTEDELTLVTDAVEEEEVDEVPVPTFPASAEDFQEHLEWMLTRILGKVGEVGPEQALFGFQQFEGMTPTQVLLQLMEKVEESMAMHAQVHILLGRIVIALETLNDQE